jgi:hypothetical protein
VLRRRGPKQRPRRVADRPRVDVARPQRLEHAQLGVAGVPVLAEVGVEADELAGARCVEPLARQVVQWQDGRVAGVPAAEREPPTRERDDLVERIVAARDEDRSEVGVDVAHAEDLRVATDPVLGDDVGGVRVPRDVDLAVQQRVHETLVVRVQDVVGRHQLRGEVRQEALPDRHDPRVIGDGPDEDRAVTAAHGTGRPASAFPIQVRSTALVGAITAPALASRRWRSNGRARV